MMAAAPGRYAMALASDMPDVRLWHELYHLETSYWREVDSNEGRQAHEFYTPDGLFAAGDNQFLGHQNIRAFYAWRQRRGLLTERHMIYNLLVVSSDECRASHTAMLSLYLAKERPPIRGTKPPNLIADIKADCVRGHDGVWRYQSHSVLPIFVGGDIPLALSIDTQILADIKRNLAKKTP
jgi:SnoaL-like domain